MQRFHFSLERVLRLKKQRERLAEARQQEALAQLRAVEREEQALQQELEEMADAMSERIGPGLDPNTWLSGQRKAAQIGRALFDLGQRRGQAAQRVVEANAARRQIAQEAEALAQLRQRQWQDYLVAAAKAEQIVLDDLGLRRWRSPDDTHAEEEMP